MYSPACHRLSACFELSRPGAAPQLRAMEGLRGLAVLLVFLVHYVSLEAPWRGGAVTPLAAALHSMGNAGVDLFFVLSGYLIYGSLMSRQQALLPYLRRRARRIYPVYSCVFALYLLLSWALPSESRIPAAWPQAFAYLASNFLLLSGFTAAPPFISVAWSLSYEMLYYLLIPCSSWSSVCASAAAAGAGASSPCSPCWRAASSPSSAVRPVCCCSSPASSSMKRWAVCRCRWRCC